RSTASSPSFPIPCRANPRPRSTSRRVRRSKPAALAPQADSCSDERLDTADADHHARAVVVLVTGGTGYVGAHAVAALVAAGHRVRVLARAPERVQAALGPLGVDDVDAEPGDVTDQGAVERALSGCDAVLHAASVFSLDPRRAEEMRSVNVRGTEIVL